jgi:uncharacterized Zn finger protein (UPF0148 family)
VKKTRQKARRVDKPCKVCKHYLYQVHPNTQHCPACAKKRLREQNNIAVQKYKRLHVEDDKKSAKRLSYEKWRAAHKTQQFAVPNNKPKQHVPFTGLQEPTYWDELFCKV